jgi:uncharacterized repeat protein (TIGR03803 family)
MRQKNSCFTMIGILMTLALVLMPAGAVAGSASKVLYKFKGGNDGGHPIAGLVFDAAGSLYGTTAEGGGQTCDGSGPCGTVFELTPNSDGSWTEHVLYRFAGGSDGIGPEAGLTFDGAGNLYGTTVFGGGSANCNGGCGTVFELTPNPDGSWTESVLYRFCQVRKCADGYSPYAGLTLDGAGNLYGTTPYGGASGIGTVFKLTPNAGGSWTESVLHSFSGFPKDGDEPFSGVIFDKKGNLYGTAGIVFKLKPNSDGSWTETVLHTFSKGGSAAPLVFDSAGNLYGTTADGGTSNAGTVFKLTPRSNGSWTESVLHSFATHGAANPRGGLLSDAVGNLYGTTVNGGAANGGAVFKLAPRSGGGWAYSVLHFFLGKPALNPYAGLVLHPTGKELYGTTEGCAIGENCRGVVFEVAP